MFTEEEKKLIISCLKKDIIDLDARKSVLKALIKEVEEGKCKEHLVDVLNSLMYDIQQRLVAGAVTEETHKLIELALKISKEIRRKLDLQQNFVGS